MSDVTQELDVKRERALERMREIKMTDAGVQLATYADAWYFAQNVCASGFAPVLNAKTGERMTPQMVVVALQMGAEVGLPPMTALKNIAVINGRPTIWGDALLALAFRKGIIEDIEEWVEGEGDARTAYCRVVRKGVKTPIVRSFSVADAKRAGLWDRFGPWKSYPDRMLAMRARGFALRDAAPDALGGFTLAEEARDMQATEEIAESRTEALLASLSDAPSTETQELPSGTLFPDEE